MKQPFITKDDLPELGKLIVILTVLAGGCVMLCGMESYVVHLIDVIFKN